MIDGYKDSPLGEIPKNWKVVKSNTVFELIHGYQFRDYDFTETGLPIAKIGQINKNGEIDMTGCSFFSSDRANEFVDKRIFNGDVLMALTGATLGKSCWVAGLENPVYQNYRVGKFVPHDENILSKQFLYFLVGSPLALDQIMSKINSGAQGNVGKSDFEKLKIPLPPIKEQQKIAEILSTVDDKIEVIDQQIIETQELKKGLMQRLLTKGIGHTEFKDSPLGEIPNSWEVVKLDTITERITKGTTPTTNGFNYLKEGINFIKIESINGNGKYLKDKFAHIGIDCHNSFLRSQLAEKDILFSIAGALGRTAIVNKDILPANTNQAIAIIRLKKHSYLHFIYHYLKSEFVFEHIKKINVSTAQANLSLGQIGKFDIPLPLMEEQTKIAEILSTIDEKLEVLSEKKTYYQELKHGLMQQLLTGKIRVKV